MTLYQPMTTQNPRPSDPACRGAAQFNNALEPHGIGPSFRYRGSGRKVSVRLNRIR
jgi:hypothetical protein